MFAQSDMKQKKYEKSEEKRRLRTPNGLCYIRNETSALSKITNSIKYQQTEPRTSQTLLLSDEFGDLTINGLATCYMLIHWIFFQFLS